MRIISHRGNLRGVDPKENFPDRIKKVAETFETEVDAWFINGLYYLGHDRPEFEVDKFFFMDSNLLVHAKTVATYLQLHRYSDVNVFLQHQDGLAVSSGGDLILHASVREEVKSSGGLIIVALDGKFDLKKGTPGGVITDMPEMVSSQHFRALGNRDTRLKPDLIICDVDGVLTDGTKVYDVNGSPVAKRFCDKDFTAIKRFQNAGVQVVWLSGDENINKNLAETRGIDFMFARLPDGNIDKEVFLEDFKDRYRAQNVIYLGDDYYDLTLLASVSASFCPSDASSDVRKLSDVVLTTPGGHGVMAELWDFYADSIRRTFAYDSKRQ